MAGVLAAGVDWSKAGWVAVVLDSSGFLGASLGSTFDELVDALTDVEVLGVDIPLGLPERPPRAADVEARRFVGPRRSSVFPTLPRDVLEAADYPTAQRIARERYGVGVPAQAFALAPRILEVSHAAGRDRRIVEVHPEVSFAAMADAHIEYSKRTWAGLEQRRALLNSRGIAVPAEIGTAGSAAADDVIDAAAAGWSARRKARGDAQTLPVDGSDSAVIWY